MSHLWIDITMLTVASILILAVCFILITLLYLCCRSIDKCVANLHWFHHSRAFISAKSDQEHASNPSQGQSFIPLQSRSVAYPNLLSSPSSNPFLDSGPRQTSAAAPSTAPRMKRAGFANPISQDMSDFTGPSNRTVTNVDRFETTFGMPLSLDQKRRITAILVDQEIEEQPQPSNYYDQTPDEQDQDANDSTFDSPTNSIRTQVHREEYPTYMTELPLEPQQVVPMLPKPPKPARPSQKQTPVR